MDTLIPLSQKLYFLGINPEKGGILSRSQSAMDYVILGGLLMELHLLKKIKFEDKRIVVLSDKAESEIHQFMLDKMNKARRKKKISTWINSFFYLHSKIRAEIQKGLEDKRLIRMQPKRFLFFKWKKPSVSNKQALYKLVDEVKSQVMNGTSVEEELILLSFLAPAGLLYRLFPERSKRKMAKERLKQMMVKNRVSAAVADAISASQAVAASVAASAAASSVATS